MKRLLIISMLLSSVSLMARVGLWSSQPQPESLEEEIRPLSCVSYLQLSIGSQGFTVLTPQMILADTFADYSPFVVTIKGRNTDTVYCDDVNGSVMVTVTDTRDGNSCWSTVYVEDKQAPVIECINDTLPCYIDPFSVDYSIYATAYDNCDDSVELYYQFYLDDLPCAHNEWVSVVRLRWIAEDDQGMASECSSRIFFSRLDVNDAVFPSDTNIYCPVVDTLDLGVPTIEGQPIDPLCDLVAVFTDDTIPGRCTGEYRIGRTWSVIDICTQALVSDIQNIFILDTLAPVIVCPDTTTIGTESDSCKGLYVVPELLVTDACAEDSLITVTIRQVGTGVVMEGDTVALDTGLHEFVCTAMDDCGNVDSCTHIVRVIDDVAPVLFCIPDIQIYVDSLGMAPELCVEDFDHINYYFDNCGIDSIMIGKMVDFCDTTLSGAFGFCVDFCCADVGEDVMVVIKVTDVAGNMNFCMIAADVLDTIPPVITHSPNDTTISCTVDYTDTTNTGGGIRVVDNCAEELAIKIQDSVDIDACKQGTVIRTFIACDPSGNADTAVQVITIVNDFVFDTSLIVWAQDTCIEDCPPDSLPETIGSMTFVMDDSCNVAVVTYSDVDISDTADVCLTIERTWTVRNECGDTVELDSVQIITIKNQGAPILSGPPTDTTINAGPDSCGADVTLPELVGTDCSSGLVVVNDCTPGGAIVSGFFPVGTKTITYTATDDCGNSSTYQTVVTVVDMDGPSMTCPSDTTMDCGASTDTSVTGIPIVADNCEDAGMGVTVVFSDSITPGSCVHEMTIERTWTATDSSGNSSTCLQTIILQDTTAPQLTCPPDMTLSCELPTDSGNTGVPTVNDNCDLVVTDIVESDSIAPGRCLNESTILRTWTATDQCGNVSTCLQTITRIDTTPPVLTCPPDITVECSEQTDTSNTGTPTIMDNCDSPGNIRVTFQDSVVRGMGQTLQIIFREWMVRDTCGNEIGCTQVITVRDTEAPTIICPPDLTVGCDTVLDDLSIFGSPDTTDNCLGITLVEDTLIDLDLCNVGTITRIFIASDSVGNSASCEQVITVTLVDSLQAEDIIWPDSVLSVDACDNIDPDSIINGRPVIDSSMAGCFRINIEYSDSISYECMPGVCTTLVRKWTVTDSCQLDTLGNGIFCFEQTIEVVDTVPPVIDVVTDPPLMGDSILVYLHPDSACEAFIRINISADDCSGIKRIRNNSRFGVDTMTNATGRYPRGLTPLRIIAEDSCCNSDTLHLLIFVLDTIPPSITCRDALKRILGETGTGIGEAEFCVSELIATALDNCDPRIEIRASFDPNDPTDTCVVYNCDSLAGLPMLMRNLTLYISDGSGNTTTCVSKVTVEDEFMVCTSTIMGGIVRNIHGEGIEKANVKVLNAGLSQDTDSKGAYSFEEGLEFGSRYQISVNKYDDPLNGISTKDIILIQRHLLGSSEFSEPWQYVAGDLNGSSSVEVSDIVRLRKLILGYIEEFEGLPDWYFMMATEEFDDPEHPLDEMGQYQHVIDSMPLSLDLDFLGIKPGDMDGSAEVSGIQRSGTRSSQEVEWRCERIPTEGSYSIYEIRYSDEINTSGFFLDLGFDPYEVEIIDVEASEALKSELDASWDNVEGRLKILWSSAGSIASEEDLSFRIVVRSGSSNESCFWSVGERSEMIDPDLEAYVIDLTYWSGDSRIERSEMILRQNRPNPFSEETVIEFFNPDAAELILEVIDASGRVVIHRPLKSSEGWQQEVLLKNEIGGEGIYHYRLIGPGAVLTRRMLLIE